MEVTSARMACEDHSLAGLVQLVDHVLRLALGEVGGIDEEVP